MIRKKLCSRFAITWLFTSIISLQSQIEHEMDVKLSSVGGLVFAPFDGQNAIIADKNQVVMVPS